MNALAALLIAIAALLTAVFGAVTIVVTRRSAKDTNRVQARVAEFEIMQGTVDTLRDSLHEAQAETDRLRGDLQQARTETAAARSEVRRLNIEVSTALANVAILSQHIREHVAPEIPFPRLRSVNGGNG